MKKAHTILSHLANQPQFRFLKQQACYKKYISLLGVKYQKSIAFVYIKAHTLFIAVTHPGFKMELNYNKDLLKSLLTMLAKNDERCKKMKADKIVLFNSKLVSILKEKPIESTVPYYQEMAMGEFIIKSEDVELKEAFNKIRSSIEKNV